MAITKSYEGLESSRILISGGAIDIIASDDGLNAAVNGGTTLTTVSMTSSLYGSSGGSGGPGGFDPGGRPGRW